MRYDHVRSGSGCAFCARNRIDPREAKALMRLSGFEPLEAFQTAHTPWRARCLDCSREVFPYLANVTQGQDGCGYCVGNKVDPAEAEALVRASGFEPLVPYPGASAPWRCRCLNCNHEVAPYYTSFQQGKGGCNLCSRGGFDSEAPATLYLITHPDMKAIKIGVTGRDNTDRVEAFATKGWSVVGTWEADRGHKALRAEGAVLRWWRESLSLPLGVADEESMKLGGHTETAPLAEVPLQETIDRLDQLLKSDNS